MVTFAKSPLVDVTDSVPSFVTMKSPTGHSPGPHSLNLDLRARVKYLNIPSLQTMELSRNQRESPSRRVPGQAFWQMTEFGHLPERKPGSIRTVRPSTLPIHASVWLPDPSYARCGQTRRVLACRPGCGHQQSNLAKSQ